MKTKLAYLLAATILAAGCSKNDTAGEKGYGSLRFVCTADGGIDIAATAVAAQPSATPSGSDFSLRLTGNGYDGNWERIADFNAEEPRLKAGTYTAEVAWGDTEAEGADRPCYAGRKQVAIVARRTTQETITARLDNAQAVVRATEQFLAYYHDIHFTLTTGSGNSFAYDLDAEEYSDSPVYVKRATTLSVEGWARRQSQNGTNAGIRVDFPVQTLDATEAGKRHIFLFDAKQTGGATLTISIGNDYTETREYEFDLNE